MKIPTLFLAAFVASTIIAFSQPTDNAPKEIRWLIKPLELPADNVELVSKDGQKISVTVLEASTRTGQVKFRKADGTEHSVMFSTLEKDTIVKLLGRRDYSRKSNTEKLDALVAKRPRTGEDLALDIEIAKERLALTQANVAKIKTENPKITEKQLKFFDMMVAADEEAVKIAEFKNRLGSEGYRNAVSEFRELDPREVQKRFRNPDELVTAIYSPATSAYGKAMRELEKPNKWNGIPEGLSLEERRRLRPSAREIFLTLDIKDPKIEDSFSLRPRFEELGFKAEEQTGPECALAAVHHLAKFAALHAGMKPKTKEELKAAYFASGWEVNPTNGAYSHDALLNCVRRVYGKEPRILNLSGNIPGQVELAKHELRNGRALLGIESGPNGQHAIVIVGYKTKPGYAQNIEWEYVDSNHTYQDGGYKKSVTAGVNASLSFE